MSNIEEDIQRQTKNTINYYKDLEKIEEIPIDILRAMYKDVLAERKQDKARIQELEEENATLRKANNITKDLTKEVKIEDITQVMNKSYEEFMSQFIPKQKVKHLIENETINISGFECIAVEDLEKLVEDKQYDSNS